MSGNTPPPPALPLGNVMESGSIVTMEPDKFYCNIPHDDMREGGYRIVWSPEVINKIIAFCAVNAISAHALPQSAAAMLDLVQYIGFMTYDTQAFQTAAQKTLDYIKRNVTARMMQPVLREVKLDQRRQLASYSVSWKLWLAQSGARLRVKTDQQGFDFTPPGHVADVHSWTEAKQCKGMTVNMIITSALGLLKKRHADGSRLIVQLPAIAAATLPTAADGQIPADISAAATLATTTGGRLDGQAAQGIAPATLLATAAGVLPTAQVPNIESTNAANNNSSTAAPTITPTTSQTVEGSRMVSEIDSFRNQVLAQDVEITALRSQAEHARTAGLERSLATRVSEIDGLPAQAKRHDECHQSIIDSLQQRISSQLSDNERLRAQVQRHNEHHQNMIQDKNAEIKSLHGRIADATGGRSPAVVAGLLRSKDSEIEQLRRECAGIHGTLMHSKDIEIEQLRNKLARAEDHAASTSTTNTTIISKKDDEIESLRGKLAATQRASHIAIENTASLKRQLASHYGEIEYLRQQLLHAEAHASSINSGNIITDPYDRQPSAISPVRATSASAPAAHQPYVSWASPLLQQQQPSIPYKMSSSPESPPTTPRPELQRETNSTPSLMAEMAGMSAIGNRYAF